MPDPGLFLKHAAIAALLALALFLIRDGRALLAGRIGAALSVSVAALIATQAADGPTTDGAAVLIARLIAVPNVALLWWFCLSLLDDGFSINRRTLAGFAAFSAGPAAYLLLDLGVQLPAVATIEVVGSALPFLMLAHVVYAAASHFSTDLLESRRRVRITLVLTIVAAAALSVASEDLADQSAGLLLRYALAAMGAVAVQYWLLELRTGALRFVDGRKERERPIHSAEPALAASLRRAIEREEAWRNPDLRIGSLADQIGAPEHALRGHINGAMGYRNFADFINSYRLAEAKRRLSDPAHASESILAIAMDSGFASLQTFNRVFRAAEGMTPTDYRRAHRDDISQN
jgi:AraC-like DNA-binding protein